MSEWLKELAWKAGIRGTVSGVRIPLSPPEKLYKFVFRISCARWGDSGAL